jgi:hypothetical protein
MDCRTVMNALTVEEQGDKFVGSKMFGSAQWLSAFRIVFFEQTKRR